MKRFATFIALLCFAASTNAQVVAPEHFQLINRIDAQTGASQQPTVRISNAQGVQSSNATFSIQFDSKHIKITPGTTVEIDGHITNLTQFSVPLQFFRSHLRLPNTWTASICFGATCYSPAKDSFSVESDDPPYYALPAGQTGAEFRWNLYCPASYKGTDSLIDYIRFVAYGSDASDTVSTLLTGYSDMPSGVYDVSPAASAQRITSVFPSPLLNGNAIRLRVSVPHEMGFNYSISDELGRQVAFGTSRVHLHAGTDNICEVDELNGFTNGNYTIKFSFSDGSVDSRMFQIMR